MTSSPVVPLASAAPSLAQAGDFERKVVGLLLACGGNILISISLNLQKWVHRQNHDEHYTKIPSWWTALALMVFGELGNFSAYAFAPAVLVAPLGGVSVLSNGIIATYMMKEPFRVRDLIGYFLAIGGGIVMVYFAPNDEPLLSPEKYKFYLGQTHFVIYFIILLMLTLGLLHLSLNTHYGVDYLIIDILICSFTGSMTVMATKGLAMSLRMAFSGDNSMFGDWVLYVTLLVVLITTGTQVFFLNKAMKNFGTGQIVPVYYVFFTLFAILGGTVLYNEFDGLRFETTCLFLFGVLSTFAGVYLIMSRRKEPSEEASALNVNTQRQPEFANKYEALLFGSMGGIGVGLVLFSFSLPLFACCGLLMGFGLGGLGMKYMGENDGETEAGRSRPSSGVVASYGTGGNEGSQQPPKPLLEAATVDSSSSAL